MQGCYSSAPKLIVQARDANMVANFTIETQIPNIVPQIAAISQNYLTGKNKKPHNYLLNFKVCFTIQICSLNITHPHWFTAKTLFVTYSLEHSYSKNSHPFLITDFKIHHTLKIKALDQQGKTVHLAL